MAPQLFYLYTFLAFSLCFHGISAMDYQVTNDAANTPGGIRFTNEIGIPYTKQIMSTISNFIRSTVFQQNNSSDQKPVDSVNVHIIPIDGAEAITSGNTINVSSTYLNGYIGDVKQEFTSLLYHEITRVFQWNGGGQAPVGLVEGIAVYTILKANYYPPDFASPGDGDSWDEGYDSTARFLEYCDGIVPGFVGKLNAKMRSSFNISYFQELTGKTVYQLWRDYKVKYAH